MVELIVAMVLLAIALAVASGAIIQQVSGSSTARAGAISDAKVARAAASFADDVAAARTLDLVGGELRDPAEFAAAVRDNAVARSSNPDPARANRPLDIDAVLQATDRELRLQVEADAMSPGTECITWRVAPGAAFAVERLVDRTRACGAGALGREQMLSAPAEVTGIDRTPFGYELACGACGGGVTCRPSPAASVPADRLRWITAATFGIDVVSGSTPGAGSSKVSIRIRDTASYRRALGC